MAAVFLLVVLVLTAGVAKLLAMCVNWICAQKLPRRLMSADKGLNALFLLGYPVVLIAGLGWSGPQYLRGGAGPIPWPWLLPIAAGAVGLVPLLYSAWRAGTYAPPACEVAVTTTVLDARTACSDWKDQLVGPRGLAWARMPHNEQFTLEVSTRTYRLPRLPEHWAGFSIVHLSDFHFRGTVARKYFELVCDQAAELKPDLFVFSGDLLDDMTCLNWIPETLGRLRGRHGQVFVLGNHDWYLDPTTIRRELSRAGWTDVAGQTLLLPDDGGRSPLVVCGDERPWMGSAADLSGIPPEAFRILVSHTPDNINWARSQQIDLMLAGHTHGGQIRLPLLGPVYSPSRYDCRFASGIFWQDPTLMCVSRGVSGREPIRYNCRPEIIRLILTPEV